MPPSKATRAKTAYEWRLNSTECRWFLPIVIPHLVLKQEQATLLLEALALKDKKKPVSGKKWTHLADPNRANINARIEAIAAEIGRLNRKGRQPDPI